MVSVSASCAEMATKTATTTKAKRNELTKVEVIEYVKKHPGVGSRNVAKVFECGKTQIQSILLHQEVLLIEYESNCPTDRKRHHTTDFMDVNDAVYKWYCLARQRCIPVSGPLLQEEAIQIARSIDPDSSFKASNGWLDSFKKCHCIKQMTVSG